MVIALPLCGIAWPASADPARTTVGDITFHHDTSAWRIVPDGDGAVATCLQADCRDVVIDISQRPSAGACTKEFAGEMAQRLFPQADRHAVNTLAAGPFALVLSQSRRGPLLGVPSYVFGCLDWQGRDYRFAMRPDTVGDRSWAGGALHHLVSSATAPAARVERLTVGAMTLDVPTDVWDLEMLVPARVARLACRPPTCRDDGAFLVVSALAVDEPPLEPVPPGMDRPAWDTRTESFTGEGLDAPTFTVTTTHSSCRNAVPPEIVATVRHGDTIHRIASPGPHGCRSGREVPGGVFEALLASARIAPASAPR
jgi:hypothetical protein